MQPIESMNRTQVIQELAQYAPSDQYHAMLAWTTDRLKALLVWYRES